jgi:hypothetical protein
VRFAGPRLAGGNDDLVPVQLRRGDRALGSALAWEQAQPLAPFPESSPFAGLQLDDAVAVNRQVLAEPTPDLHDKVWASLADGTPLVTAERRGNGLIVLVHVTANAEWSNLPLSGLFVEMLNRIVELAPATSAMTAGGEAGERLQPEQAWVPRQALDGFGMLTDRARRRCRAAAGPRHCHCQARRPTRPASTSGPARVRAVNLVPEATGFAAMGPLPAGIACAATTCRRAPGPLAGLLFTAALMLLLIDCIAALAMAGALTRLNFRRAAATLVMAGLWRACSRSTGARAQATCRRPTGSPCAPRSRPGWPMC